MAASEPMIDSDRYRSKVSDAYLAEMLAEVPALQLRIPVPPASLVIASAPPPRNVKLLHQASCDRLCSLCSQVHGESSRPLSCGNGLC